MLLHQALPGRSTKALGVQGPPGASRSLQGPPGASGASRALRASKAPARRVPPKPRTWAGWTRPPTMAGGAQVETCVRGDLNALRLDASANFYWGSKSLTETPKPLNPFYLFHPYVPAALEDGVVASVCSFIPCYPPVTKAFPRFRV